MASDSNVSYLPRRIQPPPRRPAVPLMAIAPPLRFQPSPNFRVLDAPPPPPSEVLFRTGDDPYDHEGSP